MRKIFLHIGCGKTGSSALQVWLNQNADHLNKLNIYYPTFGFNISDDHTITSGNGTGAVSAVQTGKSKEFFQRLANEHSGDVLLSSEAFQILNKEQLIELRDILSELQFQPVILAYVRDLVDILNSGYSQLVKRHAFTRKFQDYVLGLNEQRQIQQFQVVDDWSEIFQNMTLLHYDSEKKALDRSFLRALGLEENCVPAMKKNVVNRSLSAFELELLRHVNEEFSSRFDAKIDKFSIQISDALIKLHPEEKTSIIYNEEIAGHLSKKFEKKILEINNTYFAGEQRLSIFRPKGKRITLRQESIDERFVETLRIIMSMVTAMDIDGKTNKAIDKNSHVLDIKDPRIVDALRNEAIRLESVNLPASLDLMAAAKVLRPKGLVINAKINEYKDKLARKAEPKLSITWDYSSLKHGEVIYHSGLLEPGWKERHLLRFGRIVNILILSNADGKDAAWYYDVDGNFVGNNFESLNLNPRERNLLTGLIFQGILDELTGRIDTKILLPLLAKNGFFYTQIEGLIDSTRAKRQGDAMSLSDMDIMKHLAMPGRDVQDAYIRETNLQAIAKIMKDGDEYTASHGLVLNDFTVAYPCKNKRNEFIIIFESGQYNNRFAALDCANGELYERPKSGSPNSIYSLLRLLLEFIAENANAIREYLSAPVNSKVGILRNVHLGHNLWNELTALFRIEQNGLLNQLEEIVVFGGERGEPWIKLDDFSSSARINREIRSQKELISYFYSGHKFPIRLGDIFIAKEVAKRIIAHSEATCITDTTKSANELRVVFGLRLENRTWLNQKQGLLAIAQYLADKAEKISLVIDGHDVISSTNKVHASHHESSLNQIVELEKEIVEHLTSSLASRNIEIIDAVAMSLECSVKWINSADFFIAPWGAGLAKYKWISNLPGIIMTSRWNLANKPDLKIYESPSVREGATPCIYVAPEYIEDRDCSTNHVIVKDMPEHPSRADFIVDIEGIKIAIDELLTQIGKAR